MPGFMTHYLYGCEVANEITSEQQRKIISKHRKVYGMGLQGPDLFYFVPFPFTFGQKKLGSIMHVDQTGEFLENLLKYMWKLKGKEQEIAMAYVMGMLGHYTLDTKCHPYIYYTTGYMNKYEPYFGKHADFETDIDYFMMREIKKKNVADVKQKHTIIMNWQEIKVVGRMLHKTCTKTYGKLLSRPWIMMLTLLVAPHTNHVFYDPSGWKKMVVEIIENSLFGHPMVSPLFILRNKPRVWPDPFNLKRNPWINPWDPERKVRFDTFYDMKEDAKRYDLELLKLLEQDKKRELINKIGNVSYHSGLDCRIPS